MAEVGGEKKGREKPDSKPTRRYRCVVKCQYGGRLFYPGEVLETTEGDIPDVFEEIK